MKELKVLCLILSEAKHNRLFLQNLLCLFCSIFPTIIPLSDFQHSNSVLTVRLILGVFQAFIWDMKNFRALKLGFVFILVRSY